MGYWAHSWQLNELLVGDDENTPRTMEDWQNDPAVAYDEPSKVTVACIHDNFALIPILQQTQFHRFADVAASPLHDCQWEDYLTENDPNLVWVDDEGNTMSADMAPASAKE